MAGLKPYYDGGDVQLFLGDCREVLPSLGITADCVVTDPPYGETSLPWDRWPEGWLDAVQPVSLSLWCFGTLRMYLGHAGEFAAAGWKLSQDIIWEKQNGTGPGPRDRFLRVHEQPTHWYQGKWSGIYHEVPVTHDAVARSARRVRQPEHRGRIGAGGYVSTDGGPRLMRSVIYMRSLHHRAVHRTEKPVPLLRSMISYACPPGGLVVDPFAGSGSTLAAARHLGCRAAGIEVDEPRAETAAERLSQEPAFGGAA